MFGGYRDPDSHHRYWVIASQQLRVVILGTLNFPLTHHYQISKFPPSDTLGTDHLTCRGGYGFLFRSEMFFRTTRELEYFFSEFNIRLYDKNSESDYFFFPPPKSEYFFQQHWESEYFFLEKTHNPPFKLNGRSLICLLPIAYIFLRWYMDESFQYFDRFQFFWQRSRQFLRFV